MLGQHLISDHKPPRLLLKRCACFKSKMITVEKRFCTNLWNEFIETANLTSFHMQWFIQYLGETCFGRTVVLFALHIFSPAQKSTYETKRKNYTLLLRSKLKITKISTIATPLLNTATTLFNEHRSQRPFGTSDWQKILSAFSVVSVSDDHVVCNRP